MHVALVEPDWNYQVSGKDWKEYMNEQYLPIGLLKLGGFYRKMGATVELIRGNNVPEKRPNLVLITSLFTYWWEPVWKSVKKYKDLFPSAKVIVGGIYASIMPGHCKLSGCDEVYIGIVSESENITPAYDLVPECDFCVIHASRGCIRKCSYCYSHIIEPQFIPKKSIKNEIVKSKVSFLDNNLLGNPYVKNIFQELVDLNVEATYCLSGVDASLITGEIAKLMFKAKFKNIRIAFDRDDEEICCKRAIHLFKQAGYLPSEIGVFMLYNFNDSFDIVEKRRNLVHDWGAKVIPQRYIPIPSLTSDYLNSNWTEKNCEEFKSNCSKQSKCLMP